MDKISQIIELLDAIYSENENHLHIVEIKKLLSGCSDNSQVVIAYERSQLDAFIQMEFEELGLSDFKSSDEQWARAWNIIQNYDSAWTYMSDACYEAETQIAQEVHQGKEVQDA